MLSSSGVADQYSHPVFVSLGHIMPNDTYAFALRESFDVWYMTSAHGVEKVGEIRVSRAFPCDEDLDSSRVGWLDAGSEY